MNYSNFEYLNIPAKELNIIKFIEQTLFKKKQYLVILG